MPLPSKSGAVRRLALVGAILVGATLGVARAQPAPQVPIPRIIAAVSIDGRGPFRFMLDTGATQAVLTVAAARELGLRALPGATVEVRGINGVREAPQVHLDRLDVGALHFRDVDVPVLDGPVFDGVDGILGIRGLRDMQVSVSFIDGRCIIAASPRHAGGPGRHDGAVRVLSQRLPMVAARLGTVPVEAVIDTGAMHTLGNPALLKALRQAGAVQMLYGAPPIVDATEARQAGRVGVTPPLRLGNVTLPALPVTFANYGIFRTWGLEHRPALVLGMDALGTLAQFSIDYGRLELRLLARPPGPAQGARQAATAPPATGARRG